MRRPWLASCAGCAALLVAIDAQACGISASSVASCSLEEHNESVRSRWLLSISGLYTATNLRFTKNMQADQTRYATLATLAYLPTPRLVLQASVGVALGGSLSLPNGRHEFSAGPITALGVDWRV